MRSLILTGVGVGPGDPELLTLKAERVLLEADVVFAPTTSLDQPSRAEEITLAATGVQARRLIFALDDTRGPTPERRAAWDAAGQTVIRAFAEGAARIAFVTLGDPNVYSTFGYLAQTVSALDSSVAIHTVPGITAFQDLAGRFGSPLVEGREPLTLIPATAGLEQVADALERPGTVVVYKGGRHLEELTAVVRAAGRAEGAVLGTDLGLPSERIGPLADAPTGRAPYFTTLIVPPPRGERGGSL